MSRTPEELAEEYALSVEWKGDDYGARKGYYRDAFLAGYDAAAARLEKASEKCLDYATNHLECAAKYSALADRLAAAQAELKNERLWKEHYKESAQALAGETIRLGELLKVAEGAWAEIVATISRRKWIDQDGTALDIAEEALSRLRAGATVKDEEC